ncbi:hypothetical protein [Endozoicomonas sp. YOMI1]|uniref:hypothetical protein n=1 Tax=Endozoicomonas sp. YOMI1 TaxID=2828739 RepID=UPI002147DCB1|nr:hypothetical protein [Endozoicomonas sp. YOMI1]
MKEQTNDSRVAIQWEVIKRFDIYISSANTKAGVILSFSAAAFAMLMTHASMILSLHSHPLYQTILGLLGIVSAGSLLMSIWHSFHVIFPDTTPGANESLIGFPLVANFNGGAAGYAKAVAERKPSEILEDLSYQSFVLAQITRDKFLNLSAAKKYIKILIFAGALLLILIGAAELQPLYQPDSVNLGKPLSIKEGK